MDILDLQKMNKEELNKLTKDELIAAILEDRISTSCVKSVDGPHGQRLRIFEKKDAANALLETEYWIWAYNDRGEINEIIGIAVDGKDELLRASKVVTQTGSKAASASVDPRDVPAIIAAAKELKPEDVKPDDIKP